MAKAPLKNDFCYLRVFVKFLLRSRNMNLKSTDDCSKVDTGRSWKCPVVVRPFPGFREASIN